LSALRSLCGALGDWATDDRASDAVATHGRVTIRTMSEDFQPIPPARMDGAVA
jgi:hypothetical protein